jgi:hemerythrin
MTQEQVMVMHETDPAMLEDLHSHLADEEQYLEEREASHSRSHSQSLPLLQSQTE